MCEHLKLVYDINILYLILWQYQQMLKAVMTLKKIYESKNTRCSSSHCKKCDSLNQNYIFIMHVHDCLVY